MPDNANRIGQIVFQSFCPSAKYWQHCQQSIGSAEWFANTSAPAYDLRLTLESDRKGGREGANVAGQNGVQQEGYTLLPLTSSHGSRQAQYRSCQSPRSHC